MPNKTYRLYPKAVDDLEAIYSYSIREFGTQRTEDYILAIKTAFEYLAKDPLLSRKCEYITEGLRAYNVGSHVIFLKLTDEGIVIIRILHQSMDFNRYL